MLGLDRKKKRKKERKRRRQESQSVVEKQNSSSNDEDLLLEWYQKGLHHQVVRKWLQLNEAEKEAVSSDSFYKVMESMRQQKEHAYLYRCVEHLFKRESDDPVDRAYNKVLAACFLNFDGITFQNLKKAEGYISKAVYGLLVLEGPQNYKKYFSVAVLAHSTKGQILCRLGKLDDATKSYEETKRLIEVSERTHYTPSLGQDVKFNLTLDFGILFLFQGLVEKAIAELTIAQMYFKDKNDHLASLYRCCFFLGIAYVAQGKFDKAMDEFKCVPINCHDRVYGRLAVESYIRACASRNIEQNWLQSVVSQYYVKEKCIDSLIDALAPKNPTNPTTRVAPRRSSSNDSTNNQTVHNSNHRYVEADSVVSRPSSEPKKKFVMKNQRSESCFDLEEIQNGSCDRTESTTDYLSSVEFSQHSERATTSPKVVSNSHQQGRTANPQNRIEQEVLPQYHDGFDNDIIEHWLKDEHQISSVNRPQTTTSGRKTQVQTVFRPYFTDTLKRREIRPKLDEKRFSFSEDDSSPSLAISSTPDEEKSWHLDTNRVTVPTQSKAYHYDESRPECSQNVSQYRPPSKKHSYPTNSW